MKEPDEDFLALSHEERIEKVERLQVTHPRLEQLLAKIAYCHKFSKVSAEPKCLFITGETGVGKTTMIERYERKYPRVETEDGTEVRVLVSAIPVPATVKSLSTTLLEDIGDPAADRGTTIHQTYRLKKLIKACNVELIISDEFQHVIDRDSTKVLATVADWLKMLLETTKVPIVLIGMPSSTVILDANPQLRRRFTARHSLEPFGWKKDGEADEFRKLLKLISSKLPLRQRSSLTDIDIAYRFYCATGGFISAIMKLVRRGTALAIEEGTEKLLPDILAQAYDECLAADVPQMKNPFTAGAKDLDPDAVLARQQQLPLSRRSKKKDRGIGDLLTR
jgi:predicted AAA+ superfamily ATPase